MKNILFYILTAIIFLAPYKYLEQDNVNGMLFGIIAVFSVYVLKSIKANKVYSVFLVMMTGISMLSLFRTSLAIESLQGLSLYLGAFLLYFIFVQFKEKEADILKIVTYLIAINCVAYIIIQGAFYNGGILEGRIDGNIGYANTYALLMLIGLYTNNIREKDSFKGIMDLIFIQGILLTGSRNTLLYLGIFVLVNIIYKKKKTGTLSLLMLFNCILGEFIYFIISKLRLGGILIVPIILIIYFCYINDKNKKIVNILTIIAIPIGVIGVFSLESGLASRITSASVNSNELQLRIGYLEDVINYVLENPLGGGLNTYMYNQGSFQTGFYDVRYVHNSFGQALYDMGFAGFIAFAVLFISGIAVIWKGNHRNKLYYLCIYLSVYLHSILDFDFAYMVTWAVIVMVVALAGECNAEVFGKVSYARILFALAGIYILGVTSIYCIANKQLLYGNYEKSVKKGEFLSEVTKGDSSSRLLIFDGMRSLYYDTGNIEYLKTAVKTLQEAEDMNNNLHVYSKLALGYEELGDIDECFQCYEKNIEFQKHSIYVYNSYCDMLTRLEEKSGVNYEGKKAEIMNKYYKLEAERSEKSIKRFGQY